VGRREDSSVLAEVRMNLRYVQVLQECSELTLQEMKDLVMALNKLIEEENDRKTETCI
jgi:hypothetical protein